MTRFEVVNGLDLFNRVPGWRLHLAHLSLEPGSHDRVFDVAIKGTLASLRRRFPEGRLAPDPVLDATRAALREHTADGEERPATSERMVRAILDGKDFPRTSPAQVFRDLLALRTRLPWSIFDASEVLVPMMFRLGEDGETGEERGVEIDLSGLPVLSDGRNLLASPCTYQEEQCIRDDSNQVIVVCYTPMSLAHEHAARTELARLVWMTWAYKFVEERAFRPPE